MPARRTTAPRPHSDARAERQGGRNHAGPRTWAVRPRDEVPRGRSWEERRGGDRIEQDVSTACRRRLPQALLPDRLPEPRIELRITVPNEILDLSGPLAIAQANASFTVPTAAPEE